jgi:hypothetical protein
MKLNELELALHNVLTHKYTPPHLQNTSALLEAALHDRNTRLKYAIAEGHNRTRIYGNVAIAEKIQASKLPIEITIVPLDVPNANKQGIRASERDNILSTAVFSPISASFDGIELKGHKGAISVGALTEVIEDNNVIRAKGYIWADRHMDLAEYLQNKKEVGSSYEVFYATSSFDDNGIEWLEQVTFSSQTLVARPAYGLRTQARLV